MDYSIHEVPTKLRSRLLALLLTLFTSPSLDIWCVDRIIQTSYNCLSHIHDLGVEAFLITNEDLQS